MGLSARREIATGEGMSTTRNAGLSTTIFRASHLSMKARGRPQVNVRLDAAEIAAIKKLAKQLKISASELMRRAIQDKMAKAVAK